MALQLTLSRISWLARRLSRIYPEEIPYRVATLLRTEAQRIGWFSASAMPAHAARARFGNAWVRIPAASKTDVERTLGEADRLLREGVNVFDVVVPLSDGPVNWNSDPKTRIELPLSFGLHIDFRHVEGNIDIKYLWELNRHLWWVTLAQAYALSRDAKYLKALSQLLDSWLSECPYPRGPNWSSTVEHGIRLINWSIVWHLIGGTGAAIFGGTQGKQLLDRWLESIYQHQRFISDNYSFFSSADNHLIGEAAGIFVAGHTWDLWPETGRMRMRAKAILEEEIVKQFAGDGVNLEQALCYHKFSLEFLLASLLCGAANHDDFSHTFKTRMRAAIEFMGAMMDYSGRVPMIGDSDDGKVFRFVGDGAKSPYESLLRAGVMLFNSPPLLQKLNALRSGVFEHVTWLVFPEGEDEPSSNHFTSETLPTRFEQGGYILLGKALHTPSEFRLTMDVGPLGYNRIAGHGHADALSVLLTCQGDDFLVDAGTYCYNAAPELRHYFRGTRSHNTVMIDGLDQSDYGGSFLWLRDVVTTLHSFSDDGVVATVEASHDGFMRLRDPVRHFRKLVFNREKLEVLVEDSFTCSKPHECTVHWHFSPECRITQSPKGCAAVREAGILDIQIDGPGLTLDVVKGMENPRLGWVSPSFYRLQPTHVLTATGTIGDSAVIRTRLSFSSSMPH